jgi:hypothetical protein
LEALCLLLLLGPETVKGVLLLGGSGAAAACAAAALSFSSCWGFLVVFFLVLATSLFGLAAVSASHAVGPDGVLLLLVVTIPSVFW